MKQDNAYIVVGEVATIQLQGEFAELIDAKDLPLISGWHWHAMKNYKTWYVQGHRHGERKFRYLHRLIMGLDGPNVDHKNNNGLDNRRSNLRHCTQSQNMANCRQRNQARYRGVWKKSGRYRALIAVAGKRKYVGSAATAEEAARLYDEAAKKNFGEFATLNFPET